MEWRKPSDKRFTDLCIWIDANIEKIKVPGEYPEVENKIYNYLWLLVKALAIKKCMFQKFEDYDPYSFYSANRLFFALRKNLQNQGKRIKGKEIRPIKSCLNYTKTLLYPMKIEYQREAYREVIDEEFVSKKFDAFTFKQQMLEDARQSQGSAEVFADMLKDTFGSVNQILEKVLAKSPFSKSVVEYKKLKISLILNSLVALKQKKKLNADLPTIILWKLPKSMASYVKILLKEFYTELKKEIMECYSASHVDDITAEQILNYREGADYDVDNYN